MGSSEKERLGEMLLKKNLISQVQLDRALERQQATGERLGSLLVEMGFVSEPKVAVHLSKQTELPCVNVADVTIPEEILSLIPEKLARKRQMLPVRLTGDTLFLAVADPPDVDVIKEAEHISGKEAVFMIAPLFRIERAIDGNYGHKHVPFVTFAS